ncbi:DMT family transporter [Tabrizicola thermarum]|uniref:DMT family transporter n=1 Tax=Tabrizicola thermarum TaxID=2670345 RepID=UPI001EE484B7|nr:DMT family transporter [Tabrizicola thermarum]
MSDLAVAVPVPGRGKPRRWVFVAVLLWLGIGWGSTHPLGKIATETGHAPFGLIFWQQVVMVLVLGAIALVRRKGMLMTAPALRFYVIVAVLGTVIPNGTFYASVVHLPSGIMSIVIAMIPMLAFPMALALGMDRFSTLRLVGLAMGLLGVGLLAAPGAALPEPAMLAWLPVALIGPLFYAMEATYVAHRGTLGMDALQAMLGASLMGLILCIPLMLALDQGYSPWPLGRDDLALALSSALHALLYASYVWLAATAGGVFAAQSSYLVTAAGMIWAMVLLGERPSATVWLAVAVMLTGVALVQPRARQTTVEG